MQIIRTLDELDAKLRELDAAAAISDAELRRQFDTFVMQPETGEALDPEAPAYRDREFALYERIAGKPYHVANEASAVDVAAAVNRPFPYVNEGWEVTGDQLMAIGWIFKTLKLAPRASILEFGPGWGNTTIALARNGYDVTAIEIEPNFVALIEERARRIGAPITVIQGDFLDASRLGRSFDAVLFFECFHHCADHNALLDLLDALVAENGVAAFAAEPISDGFPKPWGLRLDGQSLWAIRRNGWLELGFTEAYFRASLNRRGWRVEKHVCEATPFGTIFLARRAGPGEDLAAPEASVPEPPPHEPPAPPPRSLLRRTASRLRRLVRQVSS